MTWLLSNGPDVMLWAVVAGIVGYVAWKLWLGGGDAVRVEQAAAEKKARDIADDVQNDVGTIPPDKRREELKRW